MKNILKFKLVCFLISLNALAASNEEVLKQVKESLFREHDIKVISTFFEIAQIPRNSKKEDKIRNYLIGIADSVNLRMGKNVILYQVDQVGNVLFSLEGTGRFLGQTTPVVTLQGHMDMVWAVSDADSSTNYEQIFENGVSLSFENGWLKSKVFDLNGKSVTTSIGADNGMGIAMATRYMIDFEEEHPPMALLFTIGEEQGLIGVKNIELPLLSPYLINIDSFTADKITYGCLGNSGVIAQTSFKTEKIQEGFELLTLTVRGLRGGHSGADITRPRLNAILTAIRLAKTMVDVEDVKIVSFNGGEENVLNKIPSFAEIVLAVPANSMNKFKELASETFNKLVQDATDETTAKLEMKNTSLVEGLLSLDKTGTESFIKTVLAIKNGPLAFREDSPNKLNTSSNLGFLALQQDGIAKVGLLPRSYEKEALDQVNIDNREILSRWSNSLESFKFTIRTYTQPWMSDPNGPFVKKIRQVVPSFPLGLAGGTNELAVLSEKYPNLSMISIGMLILDAHSPMERINLNSISTTYDSLDRMIRALGNY